MGLFWSMRPSGSGRAPRLLDSRGVETVHLEALVDDRRVATATVKRRVRAPSVSVKRLGLHGPGFVGRYYVPRVRHQKTPVLVLGGSEGGISQPVRLQASMFASHGHPALALGYFGLPGLPRTLCRVPLGYFAHALSWLSDRNQTSRSAIVGGSRGAEAALLVASSYPRLVSRVVAEVPSAVVQSGRCGSKLRAFPGPAWTKGGKPIPYLPYNDFGDLHPSRPDVYIPVQRIQGPVLAIGAGSDALWASATYSKEMVHRLTDAHDPYAHRALIYPGAGHAIATAVPNLPALPTKSTGGALAADERARTRAWPQILRFLN